jgi:rhamnogalacturonan endolyase
MKVFRLFLLVALAVVSARFAHAQRQMERLGRGVVAIQQPDGKVFISWRLLGTDPETVSFNLYRQADPLPARFGFPGGFAGRRQRPGNGAAPGQPVKLNAQPLTGPTWYVDDSANLATKTSYFVRPVIHGQEQAPSAPFAIAAGAPPRPYLSIPLRTPEGYTPGDGSAGDLDGDGEYELVVKMEQHPQDNSRGGATGETILQAYKLDGTYLWTINLGKNIREGAHYTQFMVYDLDGDGRAEIVCKTADGTTDGAGKVIGDPKANWVQPPGAEATIFGPVRGSTEKKEHTIQTAGHILSGPEYLTVFDGRTGAALATTNYVPGRVDGTTDFKPQALADTWGDAQGNRSDRYLAGVAYLDGVHPSVVMCRGYYTRSTLAAWDWRDGKLTLRWFFDSDKFGPPDRTNPYRGQGNHNLSVADVDGDGRDEIVYGAMVIDDDGKPLYSTGWGHADALHVSDLVPDNPGLEVFDIQERFDNQGMSMRAAGTGKPIFTIPSVKAATEGGDAGEGPGRGVAFNIDPRYPGAESWARGADMETVGMHDAHGNKISDRSPRSCNFCVYWDGDFLQELLDRNTISKWNWETAQDTPLLIAQGCTSNNGTKATPTLSADLFGDWREEVVWRTLDGKELRIYTTTIPTQHRLFTLMHDPQYRLSIAWQNVAYNQPPHPSFYLDESPQLPAWPKITVAGAKQ